MAKKLRNTKRKLRNTKRKLRNTKRKLGTKRYKGGGNLGENELKEKYKNMLLATYEVLDQASFGLKETKKEFPGVLSGKFLSNKLVQFINDTKSVDQNDAEVLKKQLVLVSEKLKKAAEDITSEIYKSKALQKAKEINTELLK